MHQISCPLSPPWLSLQVRWEGGTAVMLQQWPNICSNVQHLQKGFIGTYYPPCQVPHSLSGPTLTVRGCPPCQGPPALSSVGVCPPGHGATLPVRCHPPVGNLCIVLLLLRPNIEPLVVWATGESAADRVPTWFTCHKDGRRFAFMPAFIQFVRDYKD